MDVYRQFLKIKMDYKKTFQAGNKHSQVMLCLLSGPSRLHPLSCQPPRKRIPVKPSFRFWIISPPRNTFSVTAVSTLYMKGVMLPLGLWRLTSDAQEQLSGRTQPWVGSALQLAASCSLQKYTLTQMNGAFATLMNTFPCRTLGALDCRALLCLKLVSRNSQFFREYRSVGWTFTVMPMCL